MGVNTAACWMLIIVTIASANGKPVSTMRTHKRQSDQRVAELETLLALQKYGAHHHFLRAQSGDGGGGGGGPLSPAYGIIDFNKIGRKKKSMPLSTEEANDWVLSSLGSRLSNSPSSEVTKLRRRTTWTVRIPVMSSANEEDVDDSLSTDIM